MLRQSDASSQGAVHEFGGAAALGAVVSACLGSALAGRTDRLAGQQSVLATIDREQLEARLGWLRDYREAIEAGASGTK